MAFLFVEFVIFFQEIIITYRNYIENYINFILFFYINYTTYKLICKTPSQNMYPIR